MGERGPRATASRGSTFCRYAPAAHRFPCVPKHRVLLRDRTVCADRPTSIKGIGRPRVEPGFLFEIVDAVEEIDDVDSIGAAWLLEDLPGQRYGGSSGPNLIACLRLAERMRERGEAGSIVSLLCDRGDRYGETLFDRECLAGQGLDPGPALETLHARIARVSTKR